MKDLKACDHCHRRGRSFARTVVRASCARLRCRFGGQGSSPVAARRARTGWFAGGATTVAQAPMTGAKSASCAKAHGCRSVLWLAVLMRATAGPSCHLAEGSAPAAG